ncbi:lysine-specific demethylase 6A-like [Leptinotarsa decemlineata]|uniref:lysine-specific demethylase 6A-like n=1 Tax=Leptinotarsa decemlineata TaxID=7539 RepID=UPI003D305B2C
MSKTTAEKEDSDYSQMTAQELQVLSELDSRQYGFLLLNQPENAAKKALIRKAVRYLQMMVVQARTQQKSNENESAKNISIDPKTWVKLGHFHLLLEEYRKALSAYQMFYRTQAENHWQDTSFLYGLGLVYFHYNAFNFAIKAFQQLLYVSPGFQRANEVNLRLGIMFKVKQEYELALKHLQLALVDNSPSTASKNVMKFHVAHLYEVQGKVKMAKEKYEALLKDKTVTQSLRADIFRQLGWLYHCQESLGEKSQRIPLAIHCLQRANEADQFSGQTLYLLGRCYASVGKVHDAFIAYRNSVEKSEGNADTWCSIGVLYQQQNQPMDALQAYICAVQLDKCHSAAWANLGILYENSFQARDAYACYMNSSRGSSNNKNVEDPNTPSKLPKINFQGLNPNLAQRISFLKTHLSNAPLPSVTSQRRQLLSIEEAWNLPISAEMSSRQQSSTQPSRSAASQTFQKTYPAVAPQGPPPPYPSPNEAVTARRIKTEPEQKPVVPQPPYNLTPQQIHLLNQFQQNVDSLNPAQRSMMQHLQHQYRMMQQNQDQANVAKRLIRSPVTPAAFSGQFRNLSPTSSIKTEKMVQPNPVVEPRSFMASANPHLDETLEEDLKDLFAQKDLATTFAENLLKQFGSSDMDVKEGAVSSNSASAGNPAMSTLSSGPFSPSNIDPKPKMQSDSNVSSTG